MEKLLTRDEFREQVFKRDNYKCVFCDKPAADAHHILERRLWPDFGYYLANGASVCAEHHLACERTAISVEDVRYAAAITKVWVPTHLYDDHVYDKWGNPVLEDGRRGKGELFFDESVQKVLKEGNVLDLFTSKVKYPRTFHLPWSPGMHSDDKMSHDLTEFLGQEAVITKKMDGENTTMYSDHIHARSIDSRGGADRAWVKGFWSTIAHDIPVDWRICGENLWAEHSIHYAGLPSYFLGFSVWNEMNKCLSWVDTLQYFELLGIKNVPVLWTGTLSTNYDEAKKQIREVEKRLDYSVDEGYVIRVGRAFEYKEFKNCMRKFVRSGHVQTTKHWRNGRAFIPNDLAE